MSMSTALAAKSAASKWKKAGKASNKKVPPPEPVCFGRMGSKDPGTREISMKCLVPHFTPTNTYNCDHECPECDTIHTFPKMTLMWGCRDCDWDVCKDCYSRKNSEAAKVEFDLVTDMRRKAPRLPKNKDIRTAILDHRHDLKLLAKDLKKKSKSSQNSKLASFKAAGMMVMGNNQQQQGQFSNIVQQRQQQGQFNNNQQQQGQFNNNQQQQQQQQQGQFNQQQQQQQQQQSQFNQPQQRQLQGQFNNNQLQQPPQPQQQGQFNNQQQVQQLQVQQPQQQQGQFNNQGRFNNQQQQLQGQQQQQQQQQFNNQQQSNGQIPSFVPGTDGPTKHPYENDFVPGQQVQSQQQPPPPQQQYQQQQQAPSPLPLPQAPAPDDLNRVGSYDQLTISGAQLLDGALQEVQPPGPPLQLPEAAPLAFNPQLLPQQHSPDPSPSEPHGVVGISSQLNPEQMMAGIAGAHPSSFKATHAPGRGHQVQHGHTDHRAGVNNHDALVHHSHNNPATKNHHSLVPRADYFKERPGGYQWRKQETQEKRSITGAANHGSMKVYTSPKRLGKTAIQLALGGAVPGNPYVAEHVPSMVAKELDMISVPSPPPAEQQGSYVNVPSGGMRGGADPNSWPARTESNFQDDPRMKTLEGDALVAAAMAASDPDPRVQTLQGDELVDAAAAALGEALPSARKPPTGNGKAHPMPGGVQCGGCELFFANPNEDGDYDEVDGNEVAGHDAWFCNPCWDAHDDDDDEAGDVGDIEGEVVPALFDTAASAGYGEHHIRQQSLSAAPPAAVDEDGGDMSDFDDAPASAPQQPSYGNISFANGQPVLGGVDPAPAIVGPPPAVVGAPPADYSDDEEDFDAPPDVDNLASAHSYGQVVLDGGQLRSVASIRLSAQDEEDAELDRQIAAQNAEHHQEKIASLQSIRSMQAEGDGDDNDDDIDAMIAAEEAKITTLDGDMRVTADSIRMYNNASPHDVDLAERQQLQALAGTVDIATSHKTAGYSTAPIKAADNRLDLQIEEMIKEQNTEIESIDMRAIGSSALLVRAAGSVHAAVGATSRVGAARASDTTGPYTNVGVGFKADGSTLASTQEDGGAAAGQPGNSYVNVAPTSPLVRKGTHADAKTSFYRAKAPHTPDDDRQLVVAKGDVFKVLEKKEDWSLVVKLDPNDFACSLDSNWVSHRILENFTATGEQVEAYVRGSAERKEAKRRSYPVVPETDVFVASANYVATQKMQLSFSKGDMFRLTAKKKQWWQVEGIGDDGSHGCKGYVPSRLMNPHVPDSEA